MPGTFSVIGAAQNEPITSPERRATITRPIITAIDERRTTVVFDPARSIYDAPLAELVRLATRALTSFNLQNWRFIVRTLEARARLRSIGWDQAKITEVASPSSCAASWPKRRLSPITWRRPSTRA